MLLSSAFLKPTKFCTFLFAFGVSKDAARVKISRLPIFTLFTACDCNGMSDTCFFDPDLYRQTGRGGHCTNCRGNTDGPHCAYCKPDFYRDASGRCLDCHCDSLGKSLVLNNLSAYYFFAKICSRVRCY